MKNRNKCFAINADMDLKNQTQKREIKFRAWLPAEKKMTNCHSITEWSKILSTVYNNDSFVDNNIYLQFTGLKDKNGVDIYEGDVVAYRYSNGDKKGEIINKLQVKWGVFNIGANGFEYDFFVNGPYVEDEYMYGLMIESDVEVIGNIYENPELLTPLTILK